MVRLNIQKSQLDKLTVLNYVVTCKFTFSRPIELHVYCSRTGSFNWLFTYYFQLLTNIFPLSGLHGGLSPLAPDKLRPCPTALYKIESAIAWLLFSFRRHVKIRVAHEILLVNLSDRVQEEDVY